MNLTALALVGMTVGVAQPPADYYPIKSRTLKLDIDYKPEQRKSIQRVHLCVSQDQGQTWQIADAVQPDKDHFVFNAKEDGIYWLNMEIVFLDGRKDPPNVTRMPPAQKLLVDATAPVVRITSAKREGEDVLVEWEIDDKFPNDAATQVIFKSAGSPGEGQPVPAASVVKRSARFKPGVTGAVVVQVVAQDLAGNTGSATQEVPVGVQTAHMAPVPPSRPSAGGPSAPSGPVVPADAGPLPPPTLPTSPAPIAPAAPSTPAPPAATAPAPAGPVVPQMVPPPTVPAAENPPAPASPPNWTPPPSVPSPSPLPLADAGPQPIAQGQGGTAPPTPAAGPAPNTQFINFTRFDLQYQVENGPSGVSRIDLYVTRDEGRTWAKWSQHDGRESPLRVMLDTRFNQQIEGDYGFRLVPVSGAGLTDGAPTSGTTPEMRVHIDVTPPFIKVFPPTADPSQRNTLVLHWEATDRNFGRDPILIEWSEQPTGPWKPVTGGEGVVPVAGVQPGVNQNRIPNTGSYTWAIPPTLNTHRVYLKFTAWDAASNRSEVTTPSPILVDLTKPRAKIQAIVPGGAPPRP